MSWGRVHGHDALVQSFRRALQRGRLAHAYLFVGPAGVGKRLFAEELARALLCENGSPELLEACGHCPDCAQVLAGTHPDVLTASRPEESLELPIRVIRELCRGFTLKPARGRGKIVILDDADDLNEESANCFLKTLEEPPAHSLLILVGTSPDRQLSTILSRCQIVRFPPLSEALVAELLRTQGVEDATMIRRLARMSGGSLGQAQALADPALWDFRRTLQMTLAHPRLDSVALGKTWMAFVEEAGKESAAQRGRAARALRLFIDFLQSAVALSVGGSPRLSEPEDLKALEQLVQRVDADVLLAMLDRCLAADAQIDRRVQLVLILEALSDALGQLREPGS